jgi:hypothetical protein
MEVDIKEDETDVLASCTSHWHLEGVGGRKNDRSLYSMPINLFLFDKQPPVQISS